jgi:aminopeptidase-like protein
MRGDEIYGWLSMLFPLNRTLAGPDTRKTLDFLKSVVPNIVIKSIDSGTKVFDWEVPKEWHVREAYVENSLGERVIDYENNNLHLIGYSKPISKTLEYEELSQNLYSLPDQPDFIPYITSYYSENWGFCISEKQKGQLGPGPYKVLIDTFFQEGELNYGELLVPGKNVDEILISTYICHPSMANDNLSGVAVSLALAKWLTLQQNLEFSYRVIFLPETIGSLVYIHENLEDLIRNVKAGWVITCVGDIGQFSFIPSITGNSLSDRISRKILNDQGLHWKEYSFLDRGSDERQYCAPGCDLPVASITRSKYGEFPEYHTSGDNLEFVNTKSLQESFDIYRDILIGLERNGTFQANTIGEPNLGKRGLYPTLSTKASASTVQDLLNVYIFCNGERDLLEISELAKLPLHYVIELANKLEAADAISKIKKPFP